jgi:hypothetical protein
LKEKNLADLKVLESFAWYHDKKRFRKMRKCIGPLSRKIALDGVKN